METIMKTKASSIIAILSYFILGFSAAYLIFGDGSQKKTGIQQTTGFSPNPAYEYLVGSAAWQMSGEAHALMMQGFNIARTRVDEMVAQANTRTNGYHWETINGKVALMKEGKRVAVVCDIDDTLVDGVHYTANILGQNGEWTNKAFTEFIQSQGCTALPGSVAFTQYCIDNGIALFYVTNRYDQGYKVSESQYGGQQGYKAKDGSVIGSSTYDIFGKTIYHISMESMKSLGFPINDKSAPNYSQDAILIVNDTKLKGSDKEPVRAIIAQGGTLATGERQEESQVYPSQIQLEAHHIALLLGDDLNDISSVFGDSNLNVQSRIGKTMEYQQEWGSRWIVFPNAVYGSSMNYAMKEGIPQLFKNFDYTNLDTASWQLYQ